MTRNARRDAVRAVEAELHAAATRRAARTKAVRHWVLAGALEEDRPAFVGCAEEGDRLDLTDAQRALLSSLLTGAAWPAVVPIEDRQEARSELLEAAVVEQQGDELFVVRGAAIIAVDACAGRGMSVTATASSERAPHEFRLAITGALEVLSVRSPIDGRWSVAGIQPGAGADALVLAVRGVLDEVHDVVLHATDGRRSFERRFTEADGAWSSDGAWPARLRRGGLERIENAIRDLVTDGVPEAPVTMVIGGDVDEPARAQPSAPLGPPTTRAAATWRVHGVRAAWGAVFVACGVAIAFGMPPKDLVLIPIAYAGQHLRRLIRNVPRGWDNPWIPRSVVRVWRPAPPASATDPGPAEPTPHESAPSHPGMAVPGRSIEVSRLTYGTPPTADRVVLSQIELSALAANVLPAADPAGSARLPLTDAAEQRVLALLEQRGVIRRDGARVEWVDELVAAALSEPARAASVQSQNVPAHIPTARGLVTATTIRHREVDGIELTRDSVLRDAPERLGSPG